MDLFEKVAVKADGSMSFAGQKSDIPPVRARTPEPVQKIMQNRTPPPAGRSFDFLPSHIDVIYAEDEEIFRISAIRILQEAGFRLANIHEADHGIGALEHLARLQMEGNCTYPLVVLLDVRMPGMDGRECALQIQELVKKKLLRREPFVICISSIHRQIIVDEGKGNFQVVLPKPFTVDFVQEALELLKKWWTLGHGRQLAAWKSFAPSQMDIIAADDEPVCRLSSAAAFTRAGVCPEAITEADTAEELIDALRAAQKGRTERPLIVLLGQPTWAPMIRSSLVQFESESNNEDSDSKAPREPFVVCTSVDSDRIGKSTVVHHFHAFMPSQFARADVDWSFAGFGG